MSRRRRKKKSTPGEWLKALLAALIFFWLFTLLVFQLYPVSGTYMSGTLMPGDFILVNKSAYGPRIPVTPLSLPIFGNNLPFSNKKTYLDWIELPGYRLPGYSRVKRNDLVFFNYPGEIEKPIDRRIAYAKRCIGLPGDTIQLREKKVIVNHVPMEDPPFARNAYRIMAKPGSINRELLADLGISEGKLVSDAGVYRLYLTKSQVDTVLKLDVVDQIKLEIAEKGFGDILVFPSQRNIPWNLDHFGPVVVPGRNQRIDLSAKNARIYAELIVSENNSMEVSGKTIMINGLETDHYIFKKNYYFLLDDNRDNAKDSRYWGFLPENHLIGKVSMVVFSLDRSEEGTSAIRWNRLFKRIQ
jgi:signal peptidase I